MVENRWLVSATFQFCYQFLMSLNVRFWIKQVSWYEIKFTISSFIKIFFRSIKFSNLICVHRLTVTTFIIELHEHRTVLAQRCRPVRIQLIHIVFLRRNVFSLLLLPMIILAFFNVLRVESWNYNDPFYLYQVIPKFVDLQSLFVPILIIVSVQWNYLTWAFR